MKNAIVYCCFFLVFISFSISQEQKSKSNESNTGLLIEKTINYIGGLSCGVSIELINLKNLISNEKSNSVLIELNEYSSFFNNNDLEELINSLNIIIKTVTTEPIPVNRKEVSYKGKNGIEIGCFSKSDGWVPYILTDRTQSKSFAQLKSEDLTKLLELINKAKELL